MNGHPLPQHLSFASRALRVLALLAVVTTVYLGSNYFPVAQPQLLPRSVADEAIGWHAWTIWPYWLLLVLAPAFLLAVSHRHRLRAALQAYALAMSLNALVWLAWPTKTIRHALPDGLDPATESAWRLLYFLDGHNNCFPSGHITAPIVAVAAYCAQYPGARRWAWPLALLLFPSVVSTGQHYTWDILGGAVTAVLALWWVRRDLYRAD